MAEISQQIMDEERSKTMGLFISNAIEAEGNFLHVYDAILKKIEKEEMKGQIKKFHQDHHRHVRDLKDVAKDMEIEVPVREPQPSALGEAIVSKIEGLSDERKILKEYLVGENFSRSFYKMSLEMDAPAKVTEVLRRAHEDEERHHEWALNQLKQRG